MIQRICMVCGTEIGRIDCDTDGTSHGVCEGECAEIFEAWAMLPETQLSLAEYARSYWRKTLPTGVDPGTRR